MVERMMGGRTGPLRLAVALLLWAVSAVLLFAGGGAWAQTPVTAIADTVYHADGTAASGTVLVSWSAFTTAAGQSVPQGNTSVTLGPGGSLAVSLVANVGATPMGSYYTAVYHLDDGSVSREYWTVPVSSTPVTLSAVRASVLPSSVAMQTVTKQYVDQAIARAALGGGVPADASPYVLKTGDTMTGPLVLPGDPTAGLQASTKNYVDAAAAGLQGGLSQKVSLIPSGTQTVVQPTGTQLKVNNLQGELYANGYVSAGNDGVVNALASSDCSAGCTVVADPTYTGNDSSNTPAQNQSEVVDERGGAIAENIRNPRPRGVYAAGHTINQTETLTAAQAAASGLGSLHAYGLQLGLSALTGGNNIYQPGTAPYFKSNYSATAITGYNTTQGQHILNQAGQNCYGVGDCLMGSQYLTSAGGKRDGADEGTHPFDIEVAEDSNVFEATCTTGCTTGSTHLLTTATAAGGTQGDGRYLIDKNPSKVITTGQLVSATTGSANHPAALFSGVTFPVSTFFQTAAQALPQATNMAPGTVTLPINTTSAPSGYATNTASAPAGSGVACVDDSGGGDFETANYTVVDGTHLQLVLNKPHGSGATVAIGGLCGYGVEQTVDTVGQIRQVFPVVGSYSSTSLYYEGLGTQVLGVTNQTSGFANIQVSLTSLQRSGGVVTATTSANMPLDVNGLTLTVSGVADSSFNGSYVVTTTATNQFTYTQAGPDGTSTGGTASLLTGSYVLYPMAEVLSVYNPGVGVDGTMMLAANTVAWAAGDAVEEPHFFQQRINADTTAVTQYLPGEVGSKSAGVQYQGKTGAFVAGWIVANNTLSTTYYGNGGTRQAPQTGIGVSGEWLSSLYLQAGDLNAISVGCNSHGCNHFDSAYNLFNLQNGGGGTDTVGYVPATSTLTFGMRGTNYSISPTSMTVPTLNVTTLNASHINGLAPSATTDTTNAANITSGTLDPARLPAGYGSGSGNCSSTVAYSATPVFAVTCSNAVFHMPLSGNVTGESFTGLAAGQLITLIFQVGATPGYTVAWSPAIHGGFVTSATSGAAGYTQAGKYLVQQLVVDTDGATLLNPGAMNE